MYVDGVEQWKGKRSGAHSCTPDFNSYSGSFPNPWGGDKSGHKCFHLIDVTIAHTASYFKLEFKTSINQGESDEAWGFSNVQLSLDSNCLLPTALGLEDGGLSGGWGALADAAEQSISAEEQALLAEAESEAGGAGGGGGGGGSSDGKWEKAVRAELDWAVGEIAEHLRQSVVELAGAGAQGGDIKTEAQAVSC